MVEIGGKHNTAKVFIDNVDQVTVSQIIELLNQPFVEESDIRIMPDCHAGSGCVIGTTMTLKDKVVPNLVGVDIGCGMYALQLEESEIDLEKLDRVIEEKVPCGFDIRDNPIPIAAARTRIHQILAPVNLERAYRSLGTLGGGNHFIEVDKDSDGRLWLVIHSGSRHLGIEVCKHYQNLAWERVKSNGIEKKIKDTIEKLKEEGRYSEIENVIKALRAQERPVPKDLCYVEGENFTEYIHDMEIAQEYAAMNRQTIADEILAGMGNVHVKDSFQTIHNYIDTQNMILRKGSVSAQLGERLIIPMNMRDGALICLGKGSKDWNFSAPHGAGRIMSRSKAKETVTMDEFAESMAGVYSTSIVESTIDEAPQAYKPMDEIIKNIGGTVEVVDIIKPVYNFKAH